MGSPENSPSARKERHQRASGIKERVCGLGLMSQVTPHTCLLFHENLLSADEPGHSKLDTRLGAGNQCYCILDLSELIPHPPRAVTLQSAAWPSKLDIIWNSCSDTHPFGINLTYISSHMSTLQLQSLQNQRPAGHAHFLAVCLHGVHQNRTESTEFSLTHLSTLTKRAPW